MGQGLLQVVRALEAHLSRTSQAIEPTGVLCIWNLLLKWTKPVWICCHRGFECLVEADRGESRSCGIPCKIVRVGKG
jgi:hypothetical protein